MTGFGIGRVAGIPVRVHWTLIGLAVVFGLTAGAGALAGLASAVLLFASVVAHEVAHALVARGYGIATRDIVLTPIGGVARLEGLPRSGWAEAAIALAGPIASLAIALAAWGLSAFAGQGSLAIVLGALVRTNLMLGLFNLLPAFPMDGGRVLRGLLSERFGLRSATDVAARLGRAIAIAMGIAGVVWSMPSLVLVAVFVWMAGGSERRATERDEAERVRRERMPRAWDAWGREIPAELVMIPERAPRRVVVRWREV